MADFIRHEACDQCGSKDNKAVYSDGSSHCFGCGFTIPSEAWLEENADKGKSKSKVKTSSRKEDNSMSFGESKTTKPAITEEENQVIKGKTSTSGNGFRSIRDDVYKYFGVRHSYDEKTGEVTEQYYPVTQEGQISGYKIREVPKNFRSIGRTGADCEMFMSFRFNRGGKYLLITEGECLLPSTKVLTRHGWVELQSYTPDMGEVMQGNGEFASPVAKVFKDYNGSMVKYKSGSYELDMTPEHNMLRNDIKKGIIKVKAGDKSQKHKPVPRTVVSATDIDNLNARLQVMLSADFTFREGGDIYGTLKKERKIVRAKALLDASGVRYSVNLDSRGYSSFFIHRGHGLNVSKKFDYARDLPSAKTIIEEVVHWDGNTVPNRAQIEYSSVIRENAEFIQTCSHICGYVSSIISRQRDKYSWYKVSILFGKGSSSTQNGYTEYEYKGKVACLTMPDGTLLVKQGDSISVTGNCDSLSAYQMLKDYNSKRGSDFETAVVSPTTGANSQKQIAANYKFFNLFDQCIVAYDSDKAGQEAIEKIIPALPKGKVKIMQMRYKDANEYLEKGKEKEFISDFYAAKSYTPAGVVGSSELYSRLIESTQVKKIPLPPFMNKLDEMLNSVELGTIGVIAAGSGAAKTTVANELIYYWLFNSPYKIGVVSLELTCGQYAQAMLSRHIENKIANIKDPTDKLKFLETDHVKTKAEELFKTPDGQDRFVVIDERDGSIEVLQQKIEEMVISCDVKVIILDPISDLLDGLPLDEQANLMKWQKSIIKNYNVTFINIAHIRKGSNNKESASTGAFVPEEAVIGASQQVKSASWVVMLQRDKYSEDDVVRNTTHIMLTKNRSNGVTGKAGSMYYCNQTHRLYDLEEWSDGRVQF